MKILFYAITFEAFKAQSAQSIQSALHYAELDMDFIW